MLRHSTLHVGVAYILPTFMSLIKSACRIDQLEKENTSICDSTSSRILNIPKRFIKVGRELQDLNFPSALITQVPKYPSASSTRVTKCQVPFECQSSRVPFKCPLSVLGVILVCPLQGFP